MIDIKNYPNNKDEFVGAETLMKFLHGRSSGVFALDKTAAVSAQQSEMAVVVSDGYGWISDAEENGCVWWIETQKQTGSPAKLIIAPADSAYSRIDRIIIEWNTTLYQNHPQLKILQGSKAGTPSAPALTNNATIRQISLARVLVKAGALSIGPGDITDERADPAVCGIVTYREKIDTSVFYAQLNKLIQDLQKNINGVLDGSAYLTKTGGTMTGPLDMTGNAIHNIPSPAAGSDPVTKQYAESGMWSWYHKTYDGIWPSKSSAIFEAIAPADCMAILSASTLMTDDLGTTAFYVWVDGQEILHTRNRDKKDYYGNESISVPVVLKKGQRLKFRAYCSSNNNHNYVNVVSTRPLQFAFYQNGDTSE